MVVFPRWERYDENRYRILRSPTENRTFQSWKIILRSHTNIPSFRALPCGFLFYRLTPFPGVCEVIDIMTRRLTNAGIALLLIIALMGFLGVITGVRAASPTP